MTLKFNQHLFLHIWQDVVINNLWLCYKEYPTGTDYILFHLVPIKNLLMKRRNSLATSSSLGASYFPDHILNLHIFVKNPRLRR